MLIFVKNKSVAIYGSEFDLSNATFNIYTYYLFFHVIILILFFLKISNIYVLFLDLWSRDQYHKNKKHKYLYIILKTKRRQHLFLLNICIYFSDSWVT